MTDVWKNRELDDLYRMNEALIVEKKALFQALTEARLQLEYIQERYPTGTGESTLAKVRAALSASTLSSQ